MRTGLSIERVQRLRYVVTLPSEWQDYIQTKTIPLNFFWELKKSVIDPLAKHRPKLLLELEEDRVMSSFVQKRLSGVITDTVSLRNVTPIIHFSAKAENEGSKASAELDGSIRSLIENPDTTIEEVFENTVQIMVEADKLERRSTQMVSAFSRLLFTSKSLEERARVKSIGEMLISQLKALIGEDSERTERTS